MGEIHVSDGRVSGGDRGAKLCGIVVIILTNLYLFLSEGSSDYPFGLKIAHLILSFANIPIARIGQRIGVAIDEAVHGAAGEETHTVYVSNSLMSIIQKKYLGALVGCGLFEMIMFLVLAAIFGLFT
jgi:hypothetical protein